MERGTLGIILPRGGLISFPFYHTLHAVCRVRLCAICHVRRPPVCLFPIALISALRPRIDMGGPASDPTRAPRPRMSERARAARRERWKNRRRRHLKDGCHELMRRRRRDIFSAHNNQHRSGAEGQLNARTHKFVSSSSSFFPFASPFCPRTPLLHSKRLSTLGRRRRRRRRRK